MACNTRPLTLPCTCSGAALATSKFARQSLQIRVWKSEFARQSFHTLLPTFPFCLCIRALTHTRVRSTRSCLCTVQARTCFKQSFRVKVSTSKFASEMFNLLLQMLGHFVQEVPYVLYAGTPAWLPIFAFKLVCQCVYVCISITSRSPPHSARTPAPTCVRL